MKKIVSIVLALALLLAFATLSFAMTPGNPSSADKPTHTVWDIGGLAASILSEGDVWIALAVAAVIAVVLTVIFIRRKKK